jgi:hypothetical protein
MVAFWDSNKQSRYDWVHYDGAADCMPLIVYDDVPEARFKRQSYGPDAMANTLVEDVVVVATKF